MSFLTLLTVRNTPEILERVLGVTRLRGYSVLSLNSQPHVANDRLDISLRLESERPSERLQKHLARLYDVESVETYTKNKHYVSQGQHR